MRIKNKLEFLDRETERWRRRYRVVVPKRNPFSPVNTLALMRGAVAAQFDGVIGKYLDAVFFHMWIEPKDMSDPRIAYEALATSGLDAARDFQPARRKRGVKQRLLENTQSAVERGAFGVPTYFVGGEMFFRKAGYGASKTSIVRAEPMDDWAPSEPEPFGTVEGRPAWVYTLENSVLRVGSARRNSGIRRSARQRRSYG